MSDGTSLLPQPPRPRTDPDLIVVVGGKEFKEHSYKLRMLSDYFDAALNSGMKEAQQMTFKFPDKDPKEWELIMSLCAPFSTTQLNEHNLGAAAAWFHELCIPAGLEACDKVLLPLLETEQFSWMKDVSTNTDRVWWESKRDIETLMNYYGMAVQHNLPKSKKQGLELVTAVLRDAPSIFALEHWAAIWAMMGDHDDCRRELWNVFARSIPIGVVSKKQRDELLQNDLLPHLTFLEAQKRAQKRVTASIITNMKKEQTIPTVLMWADDLSLASGCSTPNRFASFRRHWSREDGRFHYVRP